ncbi:M3 family metallopeptidase [Mucisphaera sp.]|uniref:M3 family metallopeptidase n=1 Tax=Mucisphaera sp. TaxID=2913024 RepID=UPI003D10C43F
MTTSADNPLLITTGLPAFDRIEPAHVEPGVRAALAAVTEQFEAIEANAGPTWDAVMAPLERLEARFPYFWSPVGHLMSVKDSDDLRAAYEAIQPEVVAFGLRAGQSKPIYEALVGLRDGPHWPSLTPAQQRAVTLRIQAVERSGVALEGQAKERFEEIAKTLSKLATDFSNHVLDATKAFELIITNPADTEGWPTSLRQLAAASHRDANEGSEATPDNGPWRITLDYPSLGPFMEHSRNRAQRELVYRASNTKASSGDLDNTPLIDQILENRRDKIQLLGFDTYADYSLDAKMAPSVDKVRDMLHQLADAAKPIAEKELEELRAHAKTLGHEDELKHWDIAFYRERLREQKFDFTDEQLRPYFPLPRVLDGLFSLCTRLFGITFEQADADAPRWHDDVRYYRVLNEQSEQVAGFYLDPYARPADKRGGAWMDQCLGRMRRESGLQLPIVHLVCNGTPPVDGKPSLMSFREVETLFHEFGHGLQGMLTTVDVADVAGINGVEWDAVELASQFMENWCYHKPTLLGMTAHVDTGEPLPDDLFNKIVAARTFMTGWMTLRQVEFALTDLALHHDPTNGRTPSEIHREISEQISPMPALPEDRFLCAFSHIFAGGYAAGYYSYKWAEVLSADAFAAFEEADLDDETAVTKLGHRFRDTVLALGGGRHPMDVFRDFRGREPQIDALLRHTGLKG